MHVCSEFRERITEQILDRVDLEKDAAIQRELLVCNGCADFYSESREVIEALAAVHFDIAETQWDAMADRMRSRIHEDYETRRWSIWRNRFLIPAMAAAAAVLLVVVGLNLVHPSIPPVDRAARSAGVIAVPVSMDPSVDPVTMEFLAESELLLRSVMKLQPTAVEDLEDARRIARRQLIGLNQRKQAVSEMKPLVKVMNNYETVLRDIRNLDARPHADDIVDIKNRIEKNSLISNLTSFQPRPAAAEIGSGMEK